MRFVSLTSDWCRDDYYTGSLKGALLSRCQNLSIVEISSQIRRFDVGQCMFVLRHSFRHFPSGSIHLIAVQSEPEPLLPMVVVSAEGHYFVGLNDGRFSLLLDSPPETAYALPVPGEPCSFAALPLFVEAVAAICQDRLEELGRPCPLRSELLGRAAYDSSEIVGRVMYIDSYGNAHSNISRTLFLKVSRGRAFEIFVKGPSLKLDRISGNYYGQRPGTPLALFNTTGQLEIALQGASLADIESIDTHTEIRIKFYDKTR
jgi:Uncharacterized conserved protein